MMPLSLPRYTFLSEFIAGMEPQGTAAISFSLSFPSSFPAMKKCFVWWGSCSRSSRRRGGKRAFREKERKEEEEGNPSQHLGGAAKVILQTFPPCSSPQATLETLRRGRSEALGAAAGASIRRLRLVKHHPPICGAGGEVWVDPPVPRSACVFVRVSEELGVLLT